MTGEEDYRTSNQYFIPRNEIIDNKINEYASIVSELPIENQEPTSIIKYNKGQEYKQHHDFFHEGTKEYVEFISKTGDTNRAFTSLFYLNDEFEGGETYFPHLDLTIKPELGMCITWMNMFEKSVPNFKSLHAGLPIISGKKYIATKWIHFTPHHSTPKKNKKRESFLNKFKKK